MVKAIFFDIDGTLVSFNTHCFSLNAPSSQTVAGERYQTVYCNRTSEKFNDECCG